MWLLTLTPKQYITHKLIIHSRGLRSALHMLVMSLEKKCLPSNGKPYIHHSWPLEKWRYLKRTLENTNIRKSDVIRPGLCGVCPEISRLSCPSVWKVLEAIWGRALSCKSTVFPDSYHGHYSESPTSTSHAASRFNVQFFVFLIRSRIGPCESQNNVWIIFLIVCWDRKVPCLRIRVH
jgi:hypothetical protein